MSIAIKVENLSRDYQLDEIGTLSRDLERWFAKVRGKEAPFIYRFSTSDGITADLSEGSRFNEGEVDKTAGREYGLWAEAYFCSCPEASGWILFHQGKSN